MLDARFPSEWRRVRLEDVAEVRTGLAKGKKDVKDPVRRPYLRVANVQDGHLDLREIKHISVAKAEVDRYTLAEGDILLTEGGDADKLGRGTMWRNEVPNCLHQNHIFVVRVRRDQLLPDYLVWMTNSPHGREYFRRCSKQSTNLASINTRQLKRYPLVLPRITEQRGIARVLRAADHSLDTVQGLLKARRKLKRGLLQQLLSGQSRFPEFRKQPWVEHRVGDVLKETFRPVQWDDDEEYRLASIRRGSKGLFDRGRLFGRQIKVKKLNTIRTDDFLISHIQAAYGAMGLVPKAFDGAKVSDMYTVLTPKEPDTIDMRFFNYMSQRKEMRHMAYLSSNGFFAERLRLNFDPHDFMHRKVLLPPTIEEQTKIADTLQTLDAEIDDLQRLHDALKEQKKGLMQKLLTGQVRVPASMLKEANHG